MCGISGFFHRKGFLDVDQLLLYNEGLKHRGPDSSGYFFKKSKIGSLGLGHVRLSIIDLSESGKQPISSDHLTIVFNGEIYNFRSIRSELLEKGYSFASESDTEVVLKSFEEWGLDCVDKFKGMWAFAIFDSIDSRLYLCRDRLGVKPLYWFKDEQQFLFGSELKVFFLTKTFKKEIDTDSLLTFINYGYVTNNKTLIKNVVKAQAGAWTIVDLENLTIQIKNFWSYGNLFEKEKFHGSYLEAVEETERLVKEACELRMVSDVPVGVFLSGGFDSTLVTTLLQKDRTEKIKTFTIGFSDGIDESKDAEKIARYLGTDHTSYDCRQKDALDLIPELPTYYDDPIADISCIPTMLVSKLAAKEVKVALSADGGDELFAGYEGFKTTPEYLHILNRIPVKLVAGVVTKAASHFFKGRFSHLNKKLIAIGSVLLAPERKKLYFMHINQNSLPSEIINNLLKIPAKIDPPEFSFPDLKDQLDDLFIFGVEDILTNMLLVKVDRATMAFSLEGREPFLDHTLMEFAATLPFEFKHNGVESKRPLREIVYKYLPKEMMDRPKTGFDLPIYKWLRSDLSYLFEDFLNQKSIEKQGIFDSAYLENLKKQFKNNQLRYPQVLWRLMVFQMWYKKWFN
ncbi:asparagine synthase (glutamine-hydrolyzing) [Schleiferia thermophila]|jgi:asparagine synthase (glutamine-hydrolysing)|uniref:asparagine synthase (glutamine-hydrolyzing) n=1 Tax=Schleiferia thermophila TaxID=884107 RepID=UPI002FD9D52E